MTGQVQVYNRALNLLGLDPISSVLEENKRTRTLNLVYDMVLDELLIEEYWNFATKRAKLAQLTTNNSKYSFAYQYPADCLRLINIETSTDVLRTNQTTRPYEIQGDVIYSNQEGLYINYIEKPSNLSGYFAGFLQCLAYKIAIECCYPLINSNAREEQLRNIYETRILPKAISLDAMQEDPVEEVNYLNEIGNNINTSNVGGR